MIYINPASQLHKWGEETNTVTKNGALKDTMFEFNNPGDMECEGQVQVIVKGLENRQIKAANKKMGNLLRKAPRLQW